MNGSRQKCEHIDHALEVAEVYFTLKPFQWLYEYTQRFDGGVWNPDIVCAYLTKENKKTLIAVEVQRSPLSEAGWKNKFKIWNAYFQEAYKTAEFQQWKSKGDPIIPHIVVVSNQKNVCGLNILGRELRVIQNITEL